MTQASQTVTGVILAGGLARRMGGGDKCLLSLSGKTLLEHTIDRARPQLATLVLNVNGDARRFGLLDLPLVSDNFPNNMGPLAGIHAGLKWMRENTAHTWLASFPCDTPFFPQNLVEKLFQQTKTGPSGVNLVVTRSGKQTQSVFALWHSSLFEKIAAQLTTGTVPRLQDWIQQQTLAYVEYPSGSDEPFFNINTLEDLAAAEVIFSGKA